MVYFWTFISAPLIYMFILLPTSHCPDCYTFITLSHPRLFYFLNVVLTILGLQHFCMNFRIRLLISAEEAAGIFIEIPLNMQMNFEIIDNNIVSNSQTGNIFLFIQVFRNFIQYFFYSFQYTIINNCFVKFYLFYSS